MARSSLKHPVDEAIRKQLKAVIEPRRIQKHVGKRIGRSQGWVNKYINGAGHATIDDLIRIAHELFNPASPLLTKREKQLIERWRQLSPAVQKDVMRIVENWRRAEPRARSTEPEGHKTRGAGDKGPGTR